MAEREERRGVVLLGATGLLGHAIAGQLRLNEALSKDTILFSWSEIGAVGRQPENLAGFINARLDPSKAYDFIIACGLINPKAQPDDLEYSNYLFPRRLIEATSHESHHRYMTFGTIHETFMEAVAANPYFKSKCRLSAWIESVAEQDSYRHRLLHIRLHTLYGNPPSPIMFLGQIANSLKSGSTFKMSSGEQLREYIHADDIAAAVQVLLRIPWSFGPFLELNTGSPVRLVDLARAIFKAFDRENLLEVGAISTPQGENRDRIFQRTDPNLLPNVRDPITGVIEVLREFLRADAKGARAKESGENHPH